MGGFERVGFSPDRNSQSETGVHGASNLAHFTFDLAAPMECARAAFQVLSDLGAVSPTAAHQLTAVDTRRGLVAVTSPRALNTEPWVGHAEVGRVLEVHEVFPRGGLVVGIEGLQLEGPWMTLAPTTSEAAEVSLIAHQHPGSTVEALLQLVSHVSEGR